MQHDTGIFTAGGVAVITGAASGIGLGAARRFAQAGMKLVLFDTDQAALEQAAAALGPDVRVVAGDVARIEDVQRLKTTAYDAFGRVTVLMNNAAVGRPSTGPWTDLDAWRRVIEVNLWGVVNGVHAFVPDLLAQDGRAVVINTGSKQGITNPPGQPAYAVSKAGVRTLTEQLAHGLREQTQGRVSAHLLIPGWTYTGMTRAADGRKPDGAWTADQVVALMVERVEAGDFYILCPDNDTSARIDAARILWGAGDVAENRPALSRWDPAWKEAFARYMDGV